MPSPRPLIAVALLALLIGCGSDDSTSPPPPTPPLASDDIGSEGGVVDADVVRVEIAAGVLDDTATISIHGLDGDPVGSGQPVYGISGLPAQRNGAVTVSLAAADGLTVALAEEVRSPSDDALGWAYRRWPTELVEGRFELEIPPNDLPARKDDSLDADEIRLTTMVGDGDLLSPNDQFLIIYDPAAVTFAQAADVAAKFEAALSTYTGRGWAYPGPQRVRVELRDLQNLGKFGSWNPSKLGDSYGWFEINTQHLADPEELQATIGHEMLHMIQHYYDPRWSFFKAISGGPQYWFDEATAVWAEALFLGEDHVPDVRTDMEHFPLTGLPPDTESDQWGPQNYGYGMSALIKEIVDRNGGSESQLIGCYEDLLDENAATPMEAIMAHVPDLDDWYGAFLIDYAGGGPYDDVDVLVATLSRSGSVRAEAGQLLDERLGNDFRDRQGRLYRVQFANGTWDASASLVVSARSHELDTAVPVTIFRRAPSDEGLDHLDFMTTGDGLASYLRFGDSIEPGTEMFVLVTAAAEDSISTRIRVNQLPEVGAINYGNFGQLDFTATWPGGGTTEEDLSFGEHAGVFTGQSFTSSWTRSLADGITATGQLTVVFDPLTLTIETWSVQETRVYAGGAPAMTINATGSNVHRDDYGEPGVLYYQTGTLYTMDTCSLWRDGLGTAESWRGSTYPTFWLLLHP